MVVSDLLRERAHPWVNSYGHEFLRVLTPAPVLAIIWWLQTLNLEFWPWICLVVYSVVTLVWTTLLQRARAQEDREQYRFILRSSLVSDAFIALTLLFVASPLNGVVLALYFILTLRALCYQRSFQWVLLIPSLVGPIYLATLAFQGISTADWTLSMGSAFITLLVSSLGFSTTMLWGNIRHQREQARLVQSLQLERSGYQEQISELNGITNDLRVRIRSQQALEESLRAVTGSLRLDDVLRQILDSTIQMLGPSHVDGAAVSLRTNDGFTNHLLLPDATMDSCWIEPLARQVVQSRRTLLIVDTTTEIEWQQLRTCHVGAAIGLPLISEDGQVMGALSVVSNQPHVFSSADARHLNAFGIQACVAIRNAELHSQVRSQWAMLEAVLRDLGDGLVIYDDQGKAVFANPVAQRFLVLGDEPNELQQQIDGLVDEVQQGAGTIILREVQGAVNSLDTPAVYQAIASQARVGNDAASHVAVVLHDVTVKKAEEQARSQFISMVSHELRNPLHTLSGFLKVVLQGKAGALNPVQQDFLQTAEEQVDKLNGRINELLEFNRLQGGRMRLQRDWSRLPELANTTISALALQAEQANLLLMNNVPSDLPEILMDGKRIGQVLTNLIENAIKATPSSGTVRLHAAIVDDNIQVSITDTGIGIPEADIDRIFDPFYSTANRSRYGVHLGLGLAICQQIIQGHGGQIWVESEQGQGSTFSFTLPLVVREQELALASG